MLRKICLIGLKAMKPEFKMIMFTGFGLGCLLFGLYFGQYDVITDIIKEISKGGTMGIPTS